MKRRSTVVAFRIPSELLPLLDDERDKRGLSRGDLCRAQITAFLMRPEIDSTTSTSAIEEIAELRDEIEMIQQEQKRILAKALFVILRQLGMEEQQVNNA